MSDDSGFGAILSLIVARGGRVVVVRSVYADESGTGDEHQYMCVSGYVFEVGQAKRFSRAWQHVLDENGIPYAHMKCSGGPSGVYKHLDKPTVSAMNRNLIEIIRKNRLIGISAIVDKSYYNKTIAHLPGFPAVYPFLVACLVARVNTWSDAQGYKGKYTYVFEAGDSHEGEAHVVMSQVRKNSGSSRENRYYGHAFLPKKAALPLQAADMFAWHTTKFVRDQKSGRPPREDFRALIGMSDDSFADYSNKNVDEFKELWQNAITRSSSTASEPIDQG